MAKQPGPTGRYPAGQLTSDDKGELAVGFRIVDKTLIMHFGVDVSWVALDADSLDNLIPLLINYRDRLRETEEPPPPQKGR